MKKSFIGTFSLFALLIFIYSTATVSAAGSVSGCLTNPDGKKLAGINVSVYIIPLPVTETTTDEDGCFSATGLNSGDLLYVNPDSTGSGYNFTSDGWNGLSFTHDGTDMTGKDYIGTMPGTVSGLITHVNGGGLAGINFYDYIRYPETVTTDDEGYFSSTGYSAGDFVWPDLGLGHSSGYDFSPSGWEGSYGTQPDGTVYFVHDGSHMDGRNYIGTPEVYDAANLEHFIDATFKEGGGIIYTDPVGGVTETSPSDGNDWVDIGIADDALFVVIGWPAWTNNYYPWLIGRVGLDTYYSDNVTPRDPPPPNLKIYGIANPISWEMDPTQEVMGVDVRDDNGNLFITPGAFLFNSLEDMETVICVAAIDRKAGLLHYYQYEIESDTVRYPINVTDDEGNEVIIYNPADISTMGSITLTSDIFGTSFVGDPPFYATALWKFPDGTLPEDWREAAVAMGKAWHAGRPILWPAWGRK